MGKVKRAWGLVSSLPVFEPLECGSHLTVGQTIHILSICLDKLFFCCCFSLNTPPGTKIKLLGIVQVKNGLLLLDDSKISVLGGEVDHMVEKWELQRVRVDFVAMPYLLSQKRC